MPENRRLEALKALSRQWREKIDALEVQVDDLGGKEQLTTIELLDHLKQQQVIVDQYIDLAQRKGGDAWRKNAAALHHMLQDIDDTYRRALVHFD